MQSKLSMLINPFAKIAGWKALWIGVLAMALTAWSGQKNDIIFDGIFDVHFTTHSLYHALMCQVIILLVLTSLFWLAGVVFSKSSIRFVDIAGTMALSRVPYLLIGLIAFFPFVGQVNSIMEKLIYTLSISSFSLAEGLQFYLFLLITIFVSVWFVILAFNAFRTSCNLRGNKAGIIFFIGIIISETLALILNFWIAKILFTGAIGSATPANANEKAEYKEINTIAIEIASAIQKQDYENVYTFCDETMKKEMQLNEAMQTLENQFGPFQSFDVEKIKNMDLNGLRLVFIPCRFQHVKLNLQLAFDSEDRVCGLYFKPGIN